MKQNKFLVEYCYSQLGRPYWYGTFGQIGTEKLYKEKKNQYKTQYPPNKWTEQSFREQFGKRVHDCVGLIKGAMWSDQFNSVPKYDPKTDVSANDMIELCTESGPIETIPEMPGLIVWKEGHVGVYVSGGVCIEAKGHAFGVVQSKIKDRGFEKWGYCPFFDYETIGDFVTRLYREILEREPEREGLDFWRGQLINDIMTPSQVILEFLTGPEFVNRNLNDSEFLTILYAVFFNREPDKDGFNFWLDYIPKNGRAMTVIEFEKSEEWKRDEAVLNKTKI